MYRTGGDCAVASDGWGCGKELVTSEMFATGLPKGQRVVTQRVED